MLQRRTIFAVLALMPVAIWRPAADVFGLPRATIVWLAALVLLGCAAMRVLWARRLTVPVAPVTVAMAAFLAVATATSALSDLPALAWFGEYERYAGLWSYLSYGVLTLTTVAVFDLPDLRRAGRLVALVALVPAAYGLLQWADADIWEWTDFGFSGTFSTFGNSNFFAGYVAIVAPVGLWLASDAVERLPWRIIGGAAAAAAAVAAVVSTSFQGPVALGAGVAAAALLTAWGILREVAPRRAPLLLAGVAVVAAAGLGVLLGPLNDEVADGFDERRFFWSAAVEIAQDNPVTGTGLDTFGQYFLAVRTAEHASGYGDVIAESVHSVPLGMFSSGGVPLGAAYLALVALTAWTFLRGARRAASRSELLLVSGLAGAWVAYQVQAAVSMDLPSHAAYHWFLIGAALVVGGGVRPYVVELPGQPATTKGRRSGRPQVPASTRAAAVVVGLLLLVVAFLATRPLRADLAAGAGYRAAVAGDVTGGLEQMERATDRAPWRARYWLLRTDVLAGIGDYQEALRTAEHAAEKDPGNSHYAVFAARIANEMGDRDTARRWYDEALERNPHSMSVRNEFELWAKRQEEAEGA